MCSVDGCDSWRRSAQRFKLPEDPERRLEWVQFLLEVNGQRLKESSWTDITICSEHFTEDCFENLTQEPGTRQVKSCAVPSLCIKSEAEGPPESPPYEDPEQTTQAACQWDATNTCSSPTVKSEVSEHSLTGFPASPDQASGSVHTQQKVLNFRSNKEAELPQMERKFVVNESCLLQLFRSNCPSCGCKLQLEKLSYGVLIVLNQQCLKCDYRYNWKSQVNASIPATEDQHLTDTEEISETQQKIPTDGDPSGTVFSEIVTFMDEESDASDKGEEDDEGGESSEEEWSPTEDVVLEEVLKNEFEEETESESGEEEDLESPMGLKINELCTDCGSFFNVLKPHTCEHITKPFACSICGKRFVSESSLKYHSRIHAETYEYPCKYCYVTFKTKVDKHAHEQSHQDSKNPYKCPDCPETFATNKERGVHLTNHRSRFKCGVCGIEFKDVHHLRRHSVVHTGLKPFKCSVCQRGFNQRNNLKSHMRLHTGERPYKCQHCDKCFNHNVSLKSHVQRYHTSSSGREQKKVKKSKTVTDIVAAQENGNKRGTDAKLDNVEKEEEDKEEKVQRERKQKQKSYRKKTGRPVGRPKRNASGSSALAGQEEGQGSNKKTAQVKVRKLKRKRCSDEESEDELTRSDASFDSAEEKEERSDKVTLRKGKSKRRGNSSNSDSDFDPEDSMGKSSSQNSMKGSGRRSARPRKKKVVKDV